MTDLPFPPEVDMLSGLCRATQEAALAGEPQEVLVVGCRHWAAALGLDRAWAARLEEGGDALIGVAAFGLAQERIRGFRCDLAAAPAGAEAMERGQAVLRRDPGEWSGVADGPLVIAPLAAPSGFLGILVGDGSNGIAEGGDGRLALAGLFAEHVAIGLLLAQRLAEEESAMAALEGRVRELEARTSAWQRDRRLADESGSLLRKANRRLHAVIDQMPQGLAIARAPDGAVVLSNPAAAKILALDPSGRPTRRLLRMDGSPYPAGRLPVARALRGESCPPDEVIVEEAGKRRITLLMSAAPLLDPQGRVEEAVVVLQDITPLKEVDRLKSEIVSLVSHELRTPLHHIKGFASTLLSPDLVLDEPTRRDLLESVDQEADRLIAMVTDLLDLAKLEAGAGERAEKVPSDPGRVAKAVLRRFESVTPANPIEVRLAEGLQAVPMDRALIERVLVNLLQNAVHFSPGGSPIAVAVEPAGGQLVVRIVDHGPGVNPEDRERVFQRFHRGAGAAGGGVGLGLSICRAIVEAHGGRIWVEDTPGGGATFAFTLPFGRPGPPHGEVMLHGAGIP